ncbi:MAG: transglutaminase domain-containing protein [Pirellulaceae bacterium]|nr:transglutaminase domain-containing protein [Pirellulaceae bacterium]
MSLVSVSLKMQRVPLNRALRLACAIGCCWITSGCQRSQPLSDEVRQQLLDPVAGLKTDQPVQPLEDDIQQIRLAGQISSQDWIAPDRLPWQTAEVQYRGSVRVGYSRISVQQGELTKSGQLRLRREDFIERHFSGAAIEPRHVVYEEIQRSNGELSSFRFSSKAGEAVELETEGRLVFGELQVTRREGNAAPTTKKIPWPKGTWGSMGLQMMLMRAPMAPGKIIEGQIFIPQMSDFLPVRLEAKGPDITTLADGKAAKLLQIQATIGPPEANVLSHIWTDEYGVIAKSVTLTGEPTLQLRVDTETVDRLSDQTRFAVEIQKEFQLTADGVALPQTDPLRLRVFSLDLDLEQQFISSQRQQLRLLNASTGELSLGTLTSGGTASGASSAPLPDDLAATALVPASNSLIAQMTQEFLADQSSDDLRQRALVLQAQLNNVWQLQPRIGEIKSTIESARHRSGGNIECACVLAALLRQQQIPARLMGGLLIDAATANARFHVWTQAWVDDHWLDLDATQSEPVSRLHVAMRAVSSVGENPYRPWRELLNAVSKISDISVTIKP